MNERLKVLRKHLNLKQDELGERMKLSRSHISSLENGIREITDRIIYDICREFNVNEQWFRTGEGEMFVQPKTFTLDEKARQHNLTDLEIAIVKNYMELEPQTREQIMQMIKKSFVEVNESEIAATVENEIEAELQRYRQELEAEQKGQMLSVSERRETS